MERRGSFDYILLETTGLADPGNIAPLFWLDDSLGSSIYLDGVVTLVDAKNISKSLDDPTHRPGDPESEATPSAKSLSSLRRQESQAVDAASTGMHDGPHLSTAHLQISHADVIVINKSDLVSETELGDIQQRIQAINGLARIHVTTRGQVPSLEGTLLDLHAYDDFTDIKTFARKGHSHLDPSISTIALDLPVMAAHLLEQLDSWLRIVCWENTLPHDQGNKIDFEVHRLKGRCVGNAGKQMMIQGVREVFEMTAMDTKADDSSQTGKIVVIGRGLEHDKWQSSLDAALRS